ncbi:hypothetical protein [Sandaracinus amylolyticus]|nr:hypothetical protein [Sandaracinus amylolyticus]
MCCSAGAQALAHRSARSAGSSSCDPEQPSALHAASTLGSAPSRGDSRVRGALTDSDRDAGIAPSRGGHRMTIPITVEDLIAIGERFPSEAIIAEIDRLLPIASADLAMLEAGGYSADLLDALRGYRATLTEETAGRRAQRAAKKSARSVEAEAIAEAKRVLRAAVVMAEAAITYRVPPTGEAPETTQRITRDLAAALESARGVVGHDSAKLRTRLTAVAAVLGSASIAPAESGRAARTAMIARVTAAIAALPALAEEKKAAQHEARSNTDALDEIDGRAYLNLRTLAKVGRAQWRLAGDKTRADAYQLTLDDRRPKRSGEPTPTPA